MTSTGKEKTHSEMIAEAEEIRDLIKKLEIRDPEVADILSRIFAWTLIKTKQVDDHAGRAAMGIPI